MEPSTDSEQHFSFAFRVDGRCRSNSVSESSDLLLTEDRRKASEISNPTVCLGSVRSEAESPSQRSPSPKLPSPVRIDSIEDEDNDEPQQRRGGNATTAVNGVYKLMQDEKTQTHRTLYRHCSMVLRDEELDVDADDVASAEDDPIVELALANPLTKLANVPAGFELIGSFHMCIGNEHYQLWCRRRSSAECLRPITDVQFIAASQQEHVPFGYDAVLKLVSGERIPQPIEELSMVLCVSRNGVGAVQNLAMVHPDTQEVPPDHVPLLLTPWARPANLCGPLEDKELYLCVKKDLRSYMIPSESIQMRSELKYLTPLLLACHTREATLTLSALTYLSALIRGGFLSDIRHQSLCIEILTRTLCDASLGVPTREFYSGLLQCLVALVDTCGVNIPIRCFYDYTFCAFRVQDRRSRRTLFENIFNACFQCYTPDESAETGTAPADIAHGILFVCERNVLRCKWLQPLQTQFLSERETSSSLRTTVMELAEFLFDARPGRILATVVLLLCKIASRGHKSAEAAAATVEEDAGYGGGGRTSMLRDSLLLLRKLLRKAVEFRCLHHRLAFLIRQFLAPVVLRTFIFGDDDLFRIALDTLKFMWKNWLHLLQIEMCAMFELCVLPSLVDECAPLWRRQAMLEMLTEIIDEPQMIVDVFYNFDNIRGSSFFERLVGSLVKFTGQMNQCVHASFSTKAEMALQRHSLDLLVKVIKFMHDWYMERYAVSDVESESMKVRRGTVLMRFSKQKEAKKLREKALRLASESGVKHCIRYMITIGLMESSASAIASFLQENVEGLDASLLGEYLGGTRTAKEEPFEEEIRLAFMRRFEYPPSDFISAMRFLLTEQGFRLPLETQKIERLLSSFGVVYYERNQHRFGDPDACLVLSYLLLLLNTSLVNPNVKPHERMTLDTFVSTCHTIACSYSDAEFEEMYRTIVREPFAIPMSNGNSGTSDSFKEHSTRRFAKKCQHAYSRTTARIASQAMCEPTFFTATSIETVLSMFEISWFQFMAVLASMLSSNGIRLVPAAMNGFKYLISLAIGLGLSTETEALTAQLAKSTSKRQRSGSVPTGTGPDVHLQEHWFQSILSLAVHDRFEAISFVTEAVEVMKKDFIRDTNRRKLRELQMSFSTDINVMHPDRAYLGQGDIHKLTNKNSFRRYRLFLFSDALMYASGSATKYKVHRVIQLAFCRIENLKDTKDLRFAFRVVNPQKTFVLLAETREDKDEWMAEILDAIREVRLSRQRLIDGAKKLQRQGRMDPDLVSRLENTSAFVGKSEAMVLSASDDSPQVFDDRCKLCFRCFSMFNRKQYCPECCDVVCASCMRFRPGTGTGTGTDADVDVKQRVCDCCIATKELFLRNTASVPVIPM